MWVTSLVSSVRNRPCNAGDKIQSQTGVPGFYMPRSGWAATATRESMLCHEGIPPDAAEIPGPATKTLCGQFNWLINYFFKDVVKKFQNHGLRWPKGAQSSCPKHQSKEFSCLFIKNRQPAEKTWIYQRIQLPKMTEQNHFHKKKVKALVNKRQTYEWEIQPRQISDSLAYKPLDVIV